MLGTNKQGIIGEGTQKKVTKICSNRRHECFKLTFSSEPCEMMLKRERKPNRPTYVIKVNKCHHHIQPY